MQLYLLPNQTLTFNDQIEIYSYRSRMNAINYNTPGTSEIEFCKCGQEIKNEHLLYCINLNEVQIITHNYDDIFNGTLSKKKIIIDILRKNMEKHKQFSRAHTMLP